MLTIVFLLALYAYVHRKRGTFVTLQISLTVVGQYEPESVSFPSFVIKFTNVPINSINS